MTAPAIVLGCGMGGILAATALHRAGRRPVVLEQDDLAETFRRGTPQAGQLHNLLTRAQRHLEELLPGFREELLGAGGVEADVSLETHVRELGIQMPERSLGLRLWSAPRTVIEQVAGRLMPADVEVRDRTRVLGLDLDDRQRVRAVLVETQDGKARLETDVVVDAMGTGSLTRRWLDRATPVESHSVRQWYSTSVVRRPASWIGRPDFWLIFPDYPATRGVLVSPWGTDTWYVSLSGTADDPAPRTFKEVLSYVNGLPDRRVGQVLAGAELMIAPRTFGKPTATWRHWEELAHPIEGFLPLGDAFGSLNPLFGQGISVASWQASELADVADTAESVASLTREYLVRAAAACRTAWELMHIYAPPPGSDLPRFSPEEWQDLAGRLVDDASAHRRYVGMWHLLEPTSVLRELVPEAPATSEPAP